AEETKQGFTASELRSIMARPLPAGIDIVGLMGMASFTDDQTQIAREFSSLRLLFDQYDTLTILSMGMSGDYRIAIDCGATMIRLGTSIFGDRTNN
ncbi:MAG: alanine racemase, partial [Mucinivorans sp.]